MKFTNIFLIKGKLDPMAFFFLFCIVFFITIILILPASALIPADNISGNKSYVAEPNTNTSFIPENSEVFVPEDTTIVSATPTSIITNTPSDSKSSNPSSSSGGSSGGGGGGGASSSENFSNVIQFEEHDGTLIVGQPVPFKFNLSVYEVILTGKENEDATVRVELLKNLPQKATVKPQGEVISYFNAITSSKRLNEAVIRFNSTALWNISNKQTDEICSETLVYYYGADHNEVTCTISLIPSGIIVGTKQYYKNTPKNITYNYYPFGVSLFGWNGSSWVDMVGYTENSCADCYTYSIIGYSSFAIIRSASAIPTTTIQFLETAPAEIANTTIPTAAPKQSSGFGAGLVLVAFLIVVAVRKRW